MPKLKKSSTPENVSVPVAENEKSPNIVVVGDASPAREVSTETVNKALDVISKTFGLDDSYSVASFSDKGATVKLGLSSADFDLDVVIKKPYECHVKSLD